MTTTYVGVTLLVDFLTEFKAGLVSLRLRRKMNGTVNVLGPTSLNECGPNFVLFAYPVGVS